MGKLVVYTAIFGGVDDLKIPAEHVREPDVDYVCFTDNKDLRSDFWDIRYGSCENEDPRMNAKQYKILPHFYLPHHELSIWIDGSAEIINPLGPFVVQNLSYSPIAMCHHPKLDCVYEEAAYYFMGWRSQRYRVMEQVESYEKEGLIPHFGLLMGGMIIRRHMEEVCIDVMDNWWREIRTWTIQDQVSLGYLLWRDNPPIYKIMPKMLEKFVKFGQHTRYDSRDDRIWSTRIPLRGMFTEHTKPLRPSEIRGI